MHASFLINITLLIFRWLLKNSDTQKICSKIEKSFYAVYYYFRIIFHYLISTWPENVKTQLSDKAIESI